MHVSPEIKIGPKDKPPKTDLMAQIWGADYADNGPEMGRTDRRHRHVPGSLSTLIAERSASPPNPLRGGLLTGFRDIVKESKLAETKKEMQNSVGGTLLSRLKNAAKVVKA